VNRPRSQQRQRREVPQPLVGARPTRRERRTVAADPKVSNRFLNRMGVRRRHHAAETHPIREQVPNGDGAFRGDSIVEGRRDRFQHPAVGELGNPAIDWIVEPDSAFLDQDHRRDRCDRLRQRGDAKDRIARHRRWVAHGHRAERHDEKVIVATDERDEAGHVSPFDVSGQRLEHAVEPWLRKTSRTHRSILTPVEWPCDVRSRSRFFLAKRGNLAGRTGPRYLNGDEPAPGWHSKERTRR